MQSYRVNVNLANINTTLFEQTFQGPTHPQVSRGSDYEKLVRKRNQQIDALLSSDYRPKITGKACEQRLRFLTTKLMKNVS